MQEPQMSLDDANLTIEELENLAEEIRMILTKGNGLTMNRYKQRASTIQNSELGYRKIKALCNEPKLEAYFPDEVYNILKNRFSKDTICYLTKNDKDFIRDRQHKGFKWLASHMYTSNRSIGKMAKRCDVVVAGPFHNYSPVIIEFIKKNADKGPAWLSRNLHIPKNTIRNKTKQLGIKLTNPQTAILYTKKEDLFIKNHADKGTAWLALHLKRTKNSVKSRAWNLHIKINFIHCGKQMHKFTDQDDKFIRKNANKGALWIAQKMNLSVRSILSRANIKNIKIKIIQKRYNKEENQFIKNNSNKGIECLAKHFNVSTGAMERKLKRMKLK